MHLYSFPKYCIQLWIRPVLFSPFRDLWLIRPVLNSPSLEFYYIILSILFNSPSFEFALRLEGEKGENKTGAKISLYTVYLNGNLQVKKLNM